MNLDELLFWRKEKDYVEVMGSGMNETRRISVLRTEHVNNDKQHVPTTCCKPQAYTLAASKTKRVFQKEK